MFVKKKDTNPKDALGIKKIYFSVIPWGVVWELGVAMLEGALKYGRHNYRISGVRASVYFDALFRHASAWWEGEDIDADSEMSHVTKGIATLAVLRDGMITGNWVDDRPPPLPKGFMQELNAKVVQLLEKYPEPARAWLAIDVAAARKDLREEAKPVQVGWGEP
jgi:hypothetical protein